MDLQLKNKTAIVTGGGAGIGLAIVKSLTARTAALTHDPSKCFAIACVSLDQIFARILLEFCSNFVVPQF